MGEHDDGMSGSGRGDTAAVALAVKLAASRVREFGFAGSTPHLHRELPDGTLHLINFQRVISGVTGREPGFTVNLNVVHGALRRAWAASGHWRGRRPLRSGMDLGIADRLGSIAYGYDHWWHPADADEAADAATEVIEALQEGGLVWLDLWSDPTVAIERLLLGLTPVTTVELVAALLVDRPGDHRRRVVAEAVRRWRVRLRDWQEDVPGDAELIDVDFDDGPLLDWLVSQLEAQG